jgi:hypothetical protein
MRRVERFNKETGHWDEVEFKNLTIGDIFRLFDGEERYVNKADGNNVWIAKGKPYINKDGVWTIDTLY